MRIERIKEMRLNNKDCRNCKYGEYSDRFEIWLCYNKSSCVGWNMWEEKENETDKEN